MGELFITFEGPDGAGKTTQAARLVEQLRAAGHAVVAVHEPGGTDLGTDVRALLVRRGGRPIQPWAEALLFSACRAQLVAEVVKPALQRGAILVADRFADSTLAYQGAGRGLPVPDLALLVRLATDGLHPDLTVLLDLPVKLGLDRLQEFGKAPVEAENRPWAPPPRKPGDARDEKIAKEAQLSGRQISFFEEFRLPVPWNRFEDEGVPFQERVRAAYLAMAEREPARWVVIEAAAAAEQVQEAVWAAVCARLPGLGQGRPPPHTPPPTLGEGPGEMAQPEPGFTRPATAGPGTG